MGINNSGGIGVSFGIPQVLPNYTWATKPPVGAYVGEVISLSDFDGAFFIWNGTRWETKDFEQIQHLVPIPRTTITGATEQVIFQQSVPANFLHLGGLLSPVVMLSKSAAVETLTVRVRFGTAGTVADTLCVTPTAVTASTQLTFGNIHFGLAKTAATTLRLIWNGQASTDITVANMDTNNCFLSVTAQLSVGAETVSLEQAHCLYY